MGFRVSLNPWTSAQGLGAGVGVQEQRCDALICERFLQQWHLARVGSLGFGVRGLEFGVWGSTFGLWRLQRRVPSPECMSGVEEMAPVEGFGFGVYGLG